MRSRYIKLSKLLVVLFLTFGAFLNPTTLRAEMIIKDGEFHAYSSVRVRLEPVEWQAEEPTYITLAVHNSTDAELQLTKPVWTDFNFVPQDTGLQLRGKSYARLGHYPTTLSVKRVPAGKVLKIRYPVFLFFQRPETSRHKVMYSIELDIHKTGEERKQSDTAGTYSGYFTFEYKTPQKRSSNAEKLEVIRRGLKKKETHDEAFQHLLFLNSKAAAKQLVRMCRDGKLHMGERNVLISRLARFEPSFAIDLLKEVAISSNEAGEGISLHAMSRMVRVFGWREAVREDVKQALLEMVKHDRALVQANALTWLAHLEYQDAKDEIRAQLDDEDAEVREAAVGALHLLRRQRFEQIKRREHGD